MTIYLEKRENCIRITCLDPIFLGFTKFSHPFALGTPCRGRIGGRMPQGYWVDVGTVRGFFKTSLPLTQGQQKDFWVAREEMIEGHTTKPLRLQDRPLQGPLYLYNGLARIKLDSTHPLEVNDLEIFQWLQDQGARNPIKLNQTSKSPKAVQEIWDKYNEDTISWSGGHILIEEGRTLTALDINTSLYGEGGSKILKTDNDIHNYWKEVIPILIEVIRIRHLSGIIFVDLPRLKYKQGDFILKEFVPNLEQIEVESLGLTRGGLWELVRPRRVPSLKQQGNYK